MACETLSSDWIIRMIIRLKWIFTRFELWACKCLLNGFLVSEPPNKALHHSSMHATVGKGYFKDTSKRLGTVGAGHYMLDWNHRGMKWIRLWNPIPCAWDPIPRPRMWALECPLWVIWGKLMCYNGTQHLRKTSWCHQMKTFSALQAFCAGNSPVTGELPAQRPVVQSFDVFFDLHLNKWLSKQSWGWWFEMPSCSLWRHCNEWSKTYFSLGPFY